jgi:hypothetical protein
VTELSETVIAESSDEQVVVLVWLSLIDLEDRSPEQETFWLAELLNYEIGNGGLVQYFHNTEGECVDETVEALRRLGATEHLAVFNEAVARWDTERSTLEPMWANNEFSRSYEVSRLGELDDRWNMAAIETLEAAFVRANVEAFVA